MSALPTKPASAPGGMPVQTPQQQMQQALQAAKMQEAMKLRMAIAENLRHIKRKYIVMSGKGGVGKSTVAVNLAAALAKEGKKVGLLDLDLTNPNVPLMLNLEDAKPGGQADQIIPVALGDNLLVMSTEFFLKGRDAPIIWRGPIKMNMIQQLLGNVAWGELDYLIIDLPPGTSDEPLTIAQMLRDADGVILVTTPQKVSVLDVQKSIGFARTMHLKVAGVIENMGAFACPHCHKTTDIFGKGGGDELSSEYGVPLLGKIPLDPAVVQAGEKGIPFVWRYPESATAEAFRAAIAEIRKKEG
ncbi:MAG TPA: Mrp/NBP35 family ATP-binding protein [Candidatus Thermoplasmatota archaeon]|nr:Mrp/NBP35 family ATP-binding protein [Candidatus Thermoplasmatota archaeon]